MRRRRAQAGAAAGLELHAEPRRDRRGLELCHPDEVLEKRFYDGQHVTVTLARKIPVDDCGHTKLSRWAIIAFAKSESQAKLREAAIEEEYRIQAEQKAQREAEAEAIRLAEIQFKAGEMRNVIKVQLPNEEKIGEALMEDWYNMNRKSALDDWVRSPLEQRAVKDIFRQNYAQLSELFAMYGASVGAARAVARDGVQRVLAVRQRPCALRGQEEHA